MSDWSNASNGGAGAPGYIKISLYMYAPKVVYVYNTSDTQNNVSQTWNSSDL